MNRGPARPFTCMRLSVLLLATACLWGVEPRDLVPALLDPGHRSEAWSGLLAASGALADGRAVLDARRCAGPGGPVLVHLACPEGPADLIVAQRAVDEDELWPGLDLVALLPSEQRLHQPRAGAVEPGQALWRVEPDGRMQELDWAGGGILADLDGDGASEIVTGEPVGDGAGRSGLELRIRDGVRDGTDRLRLLCGQASHAWTFTVREEGGAWRVLLGPEERGRLRLVATLDWDAGTQRWRWPANPAIRELPVGGDDQARRAALAALPSESLPPLPDLEDRIAAALSHPYQARSLAGLDDAALGAWMGPGRTWDSLGPMGLDRPQVPEACWTLPPHQAALRLAEANRPRSFNRRHPLVTVEGPAPRVGEAVIASWCRAHGRGDDCHDGLLILHASATGSCLAQVSCSKGWGSKAPGLEVTAHHRAVLAPLDDALAAQALGVLHGILCLAASGEPAENGRHSTTADGLAEITIRSAAGDLGVSGSSWSGAGFRWSGPWDGEARLNLACLWLEQGLIPRLGPAWPGRGQEEAGRQRADARRILARVAAGELPLAAGGLAAGLLAQQDWADLPDLLAPLAGREHPRLQAARERARLRSQAVGDAAVLRGLTRSPGSEQLWALERLLAEDPPAGREELAARAQDEPDLRRRAGFAEWLRQERIPEGAAASPAAPVAEVPLVALGDPGADGYQRLLALRALDRATRKRPLAAGEVALLHRILAETARETWLPDLRRAALQLLLDRKQEVGTAELLAGLEECDFMGFGSILTAAIARLKDDPAGRPVLCAALAPLIADRSYAIRPLVWAAWEHDLRELRPALAAVATSAPEDLDGPRMAASGAHGGQRRPGAGRYHLVRQILSCWDEPDPATRARLLAAFGLAQGLHPGPGQRLGALLAGCGPARSAALPLVEAATLDEARRQAWRAALSPAERPPVPR